MKFVIYLNDKLHIHFHFVLEYLNRLFEEIRHFLDKETVVFLMISFNR